MFICLYVYLCLYIYVHVHLYVSVYIHKYIYTYIYIHLNGGWSIEIGHLLSSIHSLDTAWFQEFRDKILDEHVELKHVSHASHVWGYFAGELTHRPVPRPSSHQNDSWLLARRVRQGGRRGGGGEGGQGEGRGGGEGEGERGRGGWSYESSGAVVRAWADCGSWCPQHPIAARVVTTHGDFHLGNIVRSRVTGYLQVLDFDSTCVTHAVQASSSHTLSFSSLFFLARVSSPLCVRPMTHLFV